MTRSDLFEAHMHLIRRAGRFARAGDQEDIAQLAALGLVKACRDYNEELGIPFEAYAWMKIRSEILHYQRDAVHFIRLPRLVWQQRRQIMGIQDQLRAELGRNPTQRELLEACGYSAQEFFELWRDADPEEVRPSDVRRTRVGGRTRHARIEGVTPDFADECAFEDALARLDSITRNTVLAIVFERTSMRSIARLEGRPVREITRRRDAGLEQLRTELVG